MYVVEKYDVRNGKTFRYKIYEAVDPNNFEIVYTRVFIDNLDVIFKKLYKEYEMKSKINKDMLEVLNEVFGDTISEDLDNRHKLVKISGRWMDLDVVQELFQFIEYGFTYEQLAIEVIGRDRSNVKHVTLYVSLNRYKRFFAEYLPDVKFPKRIRKPNQKKKQKEYDWRPEIFENKSIEVKRKKVMHKEHKKIKQAKDKGKVIAVLSRHCLYENIKNELWKKVNNICTYDTLLRTLRQYYPGLLTKTLVTYLSLYKRYFKLKYNLCTLANYPETNICYEPKTLSYEYLCYNKPYRTKIKNKDYQLVRKILYKTPCNTNVLVKRTKITRRNIHVILNEMKNRRVINVVRKNKTIVYSLAFEPIGTYFE